MSSAKATMGARAASPAHGQRVTPTRISSRGERATRVSSVGSGVCPASGSPSAPRPAIPPLLSARTCPAARRCRASARPRSTASISSSASELPAVSTETETSPMMRCRKRWSIETLWTRSRGMVSRSWARTPLATSSSSPSTVNTKRHQAATVNASPTRQANTPKVSRPTGSRPEPSTTRATTMLTAPRLRRKRRAMKTTATGDCRVGVARSWRSSGGTPLTGGGSGGGGGGSSLTGTVRRRPAPRPDRRRGP